MDRRLFLKNMLGASVVAVLPLPMFEQILKAEEQKPKIDLLPKKEGFWLFNTETKLVGYGELLSVKVERNEVAISREWYDSEPESILGPPIATFEVQSLNMKMDAIWNGDSYFKAVCVGYGYRIVSTVIFVKMYGLDFVSEPSIAPKFTFQSVGESLIEMI